MNKKLNSITLGGIFAACYAIITAFFTYVLVISGSFGMVILPIFAAYYATLYSNKEIILFNLATLIVCMLVGIGDIFYPLLYVLPSLIIGDIFGLLNKTKTKFYTTIFYQAIVYSILNYITVILSEKIYETSIIRFIIFDEFTYQNFALIILFVISFAEACLCTCFVSLQLKKLKINKEFETEFPSYGYYFILSFLVLGIVFYFINNNFYYLFTFLLLSLDVVAFIFEYKTIKHKTLLTVILVLSFTIVGLILASQNLSKLILLVIGGFISAFLVVKKLIKKYNKLEEKVI